MKKLLVFLVVLFLGIFITIDIVRPVKAKDQESPYPPAIREREAAAATGDISLENVVIGHSMEIWTSAAILSIGGSEDLDIAGAIPTAGKALAFLTTNPPVEMRTYIADVLQNTGLVQPAYAQGIGFSALNPVLRIWKAFRNIAYFFIGN